jgi:carbon storage regulator
MLVLSRKLNERILIGDSIVLTVVKIQGGSVRLGIEAPADVDVVRNELLKGGRAPSGESHRR